MTASLTKLPSAEGLYLTALRSVLRRPEGKPAIPPLAVQIAGVRAASTQLADYRKLCGFADSRLLPISFPHVMAAGLHLYLLTRPTFPLPLLGLVDIRAQISQRRGIGTGEPCDFDVRLGEFREVRQGLEFDRLATVSVDGEEVWREVITTLYRVPGPRGPAKAPAAVSARLSQYLVFEAPADIGRRYARVGKDLNPIHLSALSARLFGFKRAIAHGMWSLARCAAMLSEQLGHEPMELAGEFRQPLFLPGRAALKFAHAAGARERGIEFALLGPSSDRVHLRGVLR